MAETGLGCVVWWIPMEETTEEGQTDMQENAAGQEAEAAGQEAEAAGQEAQWQI